MALVGIIEPALPVSPTTAVLLRAQGGLSLLFPGGDVKNAIDDKKSSCSTATASGDPNCTVYAGPGLGFTAGGGAGLVTALGKTRLRADLLVQYLSQGAWHYEHTHQAVGSQGEYTHKVEYSLSGTRIWLMAGFEL